MAKRLLTRDFTVYEAIVEVLVDSGIQAVFGIPGGLTGPIFRALEERKSEINTIIVRQESLASAMAETTGRIAGVPAVLLGQGPWVLGYGGVGVIEALVSSSPMLILTDFSDSHDFAMHGAYQAGLGHYGLWDARRSFAGISKRVIEARSPVDAIRGTQLAVVESLTGEPGPVTLIFSRSALSGSIGPESRPRIYAGGSAPRRGTVPARSVISKAAELLAASKSGVIVAGNGVRVGHAQDALRAAAEKFGLAVATTASGKGVFPETHPLALGVFGNFGTTVANHYVSDADAVLVVGSKLGATDTALENPKLLNPESQQLIQIDVEPLNLGRHVPVELGLLGDAREILEMIAAQPGEVGSRLGPAISRVSTIRSVLGFFDNPERASDAVPIRPERLIAELERCLPLNCIITCDAGENRLFMAHHFQTRDSQTVLMAAGVGPMGYAIPAALAAKQHEPRRPVVATTGDGGFSMAMNGLLTGIEHGLGIVVVVFNNALLGWSAHGGAPSSTWRDFDYAAIARSMGCRGWRVEDPKQLGGALSQALEPSAVPSVIDVAVSTAPTFRDVTSELVSY